MNRALVNVCLIVILTADFCGFMQGQAASNAKPEDQVVQLERDWLAADGKGDVAGLRRIIADDFMGSSSDGRVLTKEDIIPQGGGPGGFAGAAPGETSVRVFGDTAVLMGSVKTAGAQPGEFHVTLVCQKRPQGWQMIAAQLAHTASAE